MNQGLNGYKKIIYSQWGEDGILEEIFKRIGTKNKFCVEFGAGDGTTASNVWHLMKGLNWKALLIEGDERHHAKWADLVKDMPGVNVLKDYVAIVGEHSLDNILNNGKAPTDLDLLSIDIDGDDYHIWKGLSKFKPRVVIIEHNPTIPLSESIVQEPGEKERFGASISALFDLAHKKGYKLAATTRTNCIFVIDSEFTKLAIQEPDLFDVFETDNLSYVISTYTGSFYLKVNKTDGHPGYGWVYPGFSLAIKGMKKALSLCFTLNTAFSKTLSKAYMPVRIFRNK